MIALFLVVTCVLSCYSFSIRELNPTGWYHTFGGMFNQSIQEWRDSSGNNNHLYGDSSPNNFIDTEAILLNNTRTRRFFRFNLGAAMGDFFRLPTKVIGAGGKDLTVVAFASRDGYMARFPSLSENNYFLGNDGSTTGSGLAMGYNANGAIAFNLGNLGRANVRLEPLVQPEPEFQLISFVSSFNETTNLFLDGDLANNCAVNEYCLSYPGASQHFVGKNGVGNAERFFVGYLGTLVFFDRALPFCHRLAVEEDISSIFLHTMRQRAADIPACACEYTDCESCLAERRSAVNCGWCPSEQKCVRLYTSPNPSCTTDTGMSDPVSVCPTTTVTTTNMLTAKSAGGGASLTVMPTTNSENNINSTSNNTNNINNNTGGSNANNNFTGSSTSLADQRTGSDSADSSNIGLIIGASLGGGCCCLLMGAVAVFLARSKKPPSSESDGTELALQEPLGHDIGDRTSGLSNSQCTHRAAARAHTHHCHSADGPAPRKPPPSDDSFASVSTDQYVPVSPEFLKNRAETATTAPPGGGYIGYAHPGNGYAPAPSSGGAQDGQYVPMKMI